MRQIVTSLGDARGGGGASAGGRREEGLTSDRTWYAASPLPTCVKDMFSAERLVRQD